MYHLEYAQRDFLGLIDEPMVFNEQTIADVVETIASESTDSSHRIFLKVLAQTLRGTDEEFQLKLSGKKRRKFVPQNARDDARGVRESVYLFVQEQLFDSDQMEAAVASACAEFGIKRATVFNYVRQVEEEQQRLQKIIARLDESTDKK